MIISIIYNSKYIFLKYLLSLNTGIITLTPEFLTCKSILKHWYIIIEWYDKNKPMYLFQYKSIGILPKSTWILFQNLYNLSLFIKWNLVILVLKQIILDSTDRDTNISVQFLYYIQWYTTVTYIHSSIMYAVHRYESSSPKDSKKFFLLLLLSPLKTRFRFSAVTRNLHF